MSTDELCKLGVFDLARLYRRGEITPRDVVTAHLRRCERLNPKLNAFLLLLDKSAIQAAKSAEALFRAGIDLGPLQGIPVSVKDLIRVKGTRTTAGSRVLLQEPADQYDAAIVQRLRSAGAIVFGKTNLHEFASGDPDPAGPFGWVQNPRRIGHHPGMSSSGAGASIAAGLGVIALGTDTGGSIRIPAYLCGVAGLKPTNGRLNMEGIIPLSWTLDTVGPLARRVGDVAAAWLACTESGMAPNINIDRKEMDFPNSLEQAVRDWRVGIPRSQFFEQKELPVTTAFEETLKLLRSFGCQLINFDPPDIERTSELSLLITRAEAATYHERYGEREQLYGSGFLQERLLPGREIKAWVYLLARRQQNELQQRWLKLTERFDALILPSGPVVAPRHGTSTMDFGGEKIHYRALLSRFTRLFNLLGWPALTIPNGIDDQGLPVGVQIVGPPDSEIRLLTLGHQLEQALGLVEKLGIEPN